MGGLSHIELTWPRVFSQSFRAHTRENYRYALSAGTDEADPRFLSRWRLPFLWVRVLLAGFILTELMFLALLLCLMLTQGAPRAIVFAASFLPPLSASLTLMTLLWELNVPRDAPLTRLLLYAASGVFVAALLRLIKLPDGVARALIEEPVKLLIIIALLNSAAGSGRQVFGTTGLVIGAGVGFGFTFVDGVARAAGTSAGLWEYFRCLSRAVPLFGGHILFTAPVAAALALGYARTLGWREAFAGKEFLITAFCSFAARLLLELDRATVDWWWLEWLFFAGLLIELMITAYLALMDAASAGEAAESVAYIEDADDAPLFAALRDAVTVSCAAGPMVGGSWRLEHGAIVIGRNPDCVICIPSFSSEIGRYHCRVARRPEGWVVEDLHSRGGTFVSGKLLAPGTSRLLANEDLIELAGHDIAFRVRFG